MMRMRMRMRMSVREKGKRLYKMYRVLTSALAPILKLHLQWRRFRGHEHPVRWKERLGQPSHPRPPGPLIHFHAVSLGEGLAAIPLITRPSAAAAGCNILMTTTTLSAFEVLQNQLPNNVIYQFAPIDVPAAVDAFLGYWKPDAIILVESELWPNLIMGASERKISLGLINARMSRRSFQRWSVPAISPLITLMLSNFSLILPLSMAEAIQFQLLQAPPFVISSSADLKYSVGECVNSGTALKDGKDLQIQLMHRQVWMASSVHKSEFQVMLRVHRALAQSHPNILTVVVPRHPRHGLEFALALKKQGFNVTLRSDGSKLTPATSIYVIDTLGELKWFYLMIPIAVIGGSFRPTLTGHNVSEAAAVGCAVLTGPYIGHFAHMVSAMKQVNPLSVLQVSGESELIEALGYLLMDQNILDARRSAAKQAFVQLSRGTIAHVWEHLNLFVLRKAFSSDEIEPC